MMKNKIKWDEYQKFKETDHSLPVPEARPNLAQRFSAGSDGKI